MNDIKRYTYTRLAYWLQSIVVAETVPKRTGRLAKSIIVQRKGEGAVVGTAKKYAPAVHYGIRKPVVVRPKRKKALYWAGARHPVKKVVIPPRKGNPFFLKAIQKMQRRLDRDIGKVVPDLPKKVKEEIRKELSKIEDLLVE